MKMLLLVMLVWLGFATQPTRAAALQLLPAEVASPDGRVQLVFELGNDGQPGYRVDYRGLPALAWSRLGLVLRDGPRLDGGLQVLKLERRAGDNRWKPVVGERAEIRDHFNELAVSLNSTGNSNATMRIIFRAYDEGVAFRYELVGAPGSSSVIVDELSEFRFTGDHPCWTVYSAQGMYQKQSVSKVGAGCERPLTVDLQNGGWAAVGEAAMLDYARMKLQPSGRTNSLRAILDGEVRLAGPATTPWRYVLLADSPGGLLERNFLVLNLNEPCALADTSWIKPGKVIRDISLTTTGAKACVDFAAKRNLQYVLFDAGWYGDEYSGASDARQVNLDPKRSNGPFDLPEILRHAEKKDIGVILYVNQKALDANLEKLLPLYRSWGVRGVKFGFVNVGTQAATAWLHRAVRLAATNRLMVDIHDEYRPTGWERTYPNLMTVEGVRGDEEWSPASQEVTTLFTRMLAGPADHTVCYFDSRVDRVWTHGFQLAKAVCYYSPWQFIYWYDRPPIGEGAQSVADKRSMIIESPELEFFDQVPAAWDETRVLHGSIGEYAVIARRHGEIWFVGAMNSGEPRTLEVSLSFLKPGQSYKASIFRDVAEANTRTRIAMDELQVNHQGQLSMKLGAPGGQAIRIAPVTAARTSQR